MDRVDVLLTALLAMCLAAPVSVASAAETDLGAAVADFTLSDIYGASHSLRDHQGKIVVIAFLGVECPLAKLYGGRLEELAAAYQSRDRRFGRVASTATDGTLADPAAHLRSGLHV